MKLCFNDLLVGFSDALDYIEKDYFDIEKYHGKRVAYYCLLLGKAYQLSDMQLSDLMGCALLHDNGLSTHYLYEDHNECNIKWHCEEGEKNILYLPFFNNVHHVILYHHEMANGQGPFHRKAKYTPLFSQIIHLIDWIDMTYHFQNMSEETFLKMQKHLNKEKDIMFSNELIDKFFQTLTYDHIKKAQKDLEGCFYKIRPLIIKDYQASELLAICRLFADIIDAKSLTTKTHSIGVAAKAAEMACYYHYDEITVLKIFIAGVMHDLGKIAIERDILEKPTKLNDLEYAHIQTHVYYTYQFLNEMRLGDIVHWASYHHEKLDGSGYPFGKKANQLDAIDRLIACCDIYQALREKRLYKDAIDHHATISIMRDMVNEGKIDGKIVEDMNILFSRS